jgi:hypothetical protein
MNIGQTINKMEAASRLGNFHNFTYKNERKNKKRLIIDTAFARCKEGKEGNYKEVELEGYSDTKMRWWGYGCKNFEIDLTQPLQIDKDCDIFIEQLTLWGINSPGDIYNQMIYLNINEFNNETSTNNVLDRYYMLPNESQNSNFESCDTPCGGGFVFKSKKLNYLASSPAKRLSRLNLTIIGETSSGEDSNSNGDVNIKLDSVFSNNNKGRCLLELIIVEKE